MKAVYLHLGLSKTGTTFLQERYFPHLNGVHLIVQTEAYPPTGMTGLLWRATEAYPLFIDVAEQKVKVDQFLQEIADDKVLISDERLGGEELWGFRDLFQSTECLRHLFPSARIILTIRRQDELIESLYRQFLKIYLSPTINGFIGYVPPGRSSTERDVNHRFENWLKPPTTYPSINVSRLDYRVFARRYATLFGRENVLILPQEMMRKDPHRFYTMLAGFMDVEPYFPPPDVADANRAYSLLSCRIAMLLNRFVRHPRYEKRSWRVIPHQPLTGYLHRPTAHRPAHQLLDALNQRLSLRYVLENVVDRIHYRRGHLLSDEQRRLIMEIHRESNRELDVDYEIDLREYGYY